MALLSKKGMAVLLAAFAGSFAVTYLASRSAPLSFISNNRTGNDWKPGDSEPKTESSGDNANISANNMPMLSQKQNPASFGTGTQVLTLSQGGYVSKRILGCWHGTTAARPLEWRRLSPLGAIEAYHRDNVDLCLNWKNNELEVTDSRWSCAGCNYSKNHRSSYQVVSASGDQVTLQVEDSARPLTNKGRQDFVLNQDDTIDERIAFSGYVLGLRTIEGVTTAHLTRSHE